MPEVEGLQDYLVVGLAFPAGTMTCASKGGAWHRDSSCWNLLLQEWDFEQPGLVEGVPAHGKGVGTR